MSAYLRTQDNNLAIWEVINGYLLKEEREVTAQNIHNRDYFPTGLEDFAF